MHTTHAPGSARTSAHDLKRMLDGGRPLYLLDVRSPEEFAEWRIPRAVNLPLPRLLAGERPNVPAGAHLVTVCLHGPRSEKARDALRDSGFDVSSLAGGMVAWNAVYDVASVSGERVEVRQLRRVGKGCLGYVVASRGEAIAIDATIDVDAFLDAAKQMGARLVKVLDTHAHADHASGGRALAAAAGAEYLAPAEVGDAADAHLRDGDEVRLGEATLRVLATPGHTPGSVAYLVNDLAFTGDTLFVESVGRPDLGQDPRPNAAALWRTLHERLLALPGATRVLPGHFGEGVEIEAGRPLVATIDGLRARLPALSMPEDDFVARVAQGAMPKPANFERIKLHNRGLEEVDLEELRELEAGPNRCAVA